MEKKGAEIIIETLEKKGVRLVSGIPGGSNLPIYDALSKSRKITHILARHEQGAGFIAQGIARTTGKAGVCIATSGPGVTNLLTALADAKLDSIPMIAITGQVASSLLGTDAFQEVDTYGLSLPITKHNFFIKNADEIEKTLFEAFWIAESGRPGPVLIDIPKDVQNQIIDFISMEDESRFEPKEEWNEEDLKKTAEKINRAQKPVLYIGGGVLSAEASQEIQTLSEKNSIPVVSTLMGLGAISSDHPLFSGMIGMHGAPCVNMMMEEADLIIVTGARFDDRATGKVDAFCKKASVIHIDIDKAEIDKIRKTDLYLAGDLKKIIGKLIPMIESSKRENWIQETEKLKKEHPMPFPKKKYHPASLIQRIGRELPDDAIIITDVGQHQMWTAQHYPFQKPRSFLTSGGLGTMGFGLPAAIGAALANPDKKIILFTGDGSFLMNIQELAVVHEWNLNITIIILNNRQLGMVKQQQELFFAKNYFASQFHYTPDFDSIGKGFGIRSIRIENETEEAKYFDDMIESKTPFLVEWMTDPDENVFPIVPPGKSNIEMIQE
ncbi:MAG TPA: biosynthetic-type acetolactate synthase large subunit [Spirochaetia bacterium]|nr:MAG: acetolactate synthase, large subunit, biosynthetic type [Spirochaetes bacterium GWB1_36_13]HCL56364.1 biosynthetic-type acetolactate synthase large subunit [Spirochaetia bacterium]